MGCTCRLRSPLAHLKQAAFGDVLVNKGGVFFLGWGPPQPPTHQHFGGFVQSSRPLGRDARGLPWVSPFKGWNFCGSSDVEAVCLKPDHFRSVGELVSKISSTARARTISGAPATVLPQRFAGDTESSATNLHRSIAQHQHDKHRAPRRPQALHRVAKLVRAPRPARADHSSIGSHRGASAQAPVQGVEISSFDQRDMLGPLGLVGSRFGAWSTRRQYSTSRRFLRHLHAVCMATR